MSPFCLWCDERALADGLLNVALFAPLGWTLGRWRGVAWAALAGGALSLGVEIAQWGIPGRHPSATDVLFNAAGAALGAVLAGRLSRTLPWMVAGALAGLVAPMLLLAPSPPAAVYYGQWTARFENMAAYAGRVMAASVGGVEMSDGRSAHSPEVRQALEHRERISVRFIAGPEPAGLAPVFSVYDHLQREIFLLGVDGRDLVFRQWMRSTDLRLDGPELRFPGALAGVSPGDTVDAAVFAGETSPCISLNGRTKCDIAPGFAAGWTLLLYPPPFGIPLAEMADLLWVGALALPLGFALRRPAVALPLAVLLAAVLLTWAQVAPDTRAQPTSGLPLVLGMALGAALARRRRGEGAA